MYCKLCKRKLRDIKDDWAERQLHKKCWLDHLKMEQMKEYLRICGYTKT